MQTKRIGEEGAVRKTVNKRQGIRNTNGPLWNPPSLDRRRRCRSVVVAVVRRSFSARVSAQMFGGRGRRRGGVRVYLQRFSIQMLSDLIVSFFVALLLNHRQPATQGPIFPAKVFFLLYHSFHSLSVFCSWHKIFLSCRLASYCSGLVPNDSYSFCCYCGSPS